MTRAIALQLPSPEELEPPAGYLDAAQGGEELRAKRAELRAQSEALAAKSLAATRDMIAKVEAEPGPVHQRQAQVMIEMIREREQQAVRLLAFYRKVHTKFARVLLEMTKGRVGQYAANEMRDTLRESLTYVAGDIERQKEICRAYRDLRWSLVALAAESAERGPGPLVSTPEEYLALRRGE